MAGELSRADYAARYGPTKGDRVRLGDTNLIALIERDETSYGDEVLRGWAKTMRTGIMMSDRTSSASELDLLISNVVRSEERRVGKECRSRRQPSQYKEKGKRPRQDLPRRYHMTNAED